MSLLYTGLIPAAYLLGSVNSAIITCRLLRLSDPRAGGSGNPGATNVLRLHGRKAALYTLGGDLLKGFLPVLAADWLARQGTVPGSVPLLCMAAVVLGHVYPAYSGLRRGGKGVATLFGALWALHWLLGLLFTGSWLALALLSGYSSIASLGSIALLGLAAPRILGQPVAGIILGALFLVILWRHRGNLHRLRRGKEHRLHGRRPGDS